jgi:hypothetical protein
MSNENVIPFPAVINPMALMQMPRVTTELLSKELIDMDSYKRIADAMTADIAFLYSVANDFFTEQFDADALAGIAELLGELAETAGQENPISAELNRASLRLSRLAIRLAAMKETATC